MNLDIGRELRIDAALETGTVNESVVVSATSPLLETETGMFVLAVQRGRRWVYRPRPRFTLEPGDRLISIGPEEGAEELYAVASAPEPEPAPS